MVAFSLTGLAIAALAAATMELVAFLAHKYVMHGPGWAWHQSHHEPRQGMFEKNDLYAAVFAGLSILLFLLGTIWWAPLWWIALGITFYGLLYALVHDGLVHRRFPFLRSPRSGYLKRLVQAHRLHHAVHGREGAVSFGFLYAPPISKLRAQLRAGREDA